MKGIINLEYAILDNPPLHMPKKITRAIHCCRRHAHVWTDSKCFVVWQGEALVYGEFIEVLSVDRENWYQAWTEKGLFKLPGKHDFTDRENEQLERQGYFW